MRPRKLEGEETGEVAEGIGAAIGGMGVEKFQIEEVATKHDIPVYAVLVKEGDLDVMATMKKEIADGAERAVEPREEDNPREDEGRGHRPPRGHREHPGGRPVGGR